MSNNIAFSFSNCGLTDTQVVQLIGKLDHSSNMGNWRQKIRELHLSGNSLTHTGINQFFGSIIPSCHLTHLDLSHNPLGVEGLQVLEDAINEMMLESIQNLILQNCLTCDPDINGALLTTFLEAVFTHYRQLNCLDLSSNNLGLPGAQSLQQASMLSQLHLSLFLNNTALGDEGLRAFAQGNWNLYKLGLQGNSIHAKGILSLAEGFSSGRCVVGNLLLDDNPLCLEGSRAVGEMLCGGKNGKLCTISMARCKLTNTDSNCPQRRYVALQLFQALQNENIIELYVDENDFAGESIYVLAGFLHLCPKIQYFYSTHCGISSVDIKRLVRCLPSLQLGWSEIKFWKLGHNRINDFAMYDIAIISHRMAVSLNHNLISDAMATKIWQVSL